MATRPARPRRVRLPRLGAACRTALWPPSLPKSVPSSRRRRGCPPSANTSPHSTRSSVEPTPSRSATNWGYSMTQQSEPASSLDDPRLLFFLEHEEQLRDWAALSTEVFEAVEATLQQLGLELGAHPRVAADGIRVSDRVNGETFHAPLLYRDEWCRSTPALPDVAIGLGWDTKVDPRGIWRGASRPYAGVRTAHQDTAGPAIEAAL